MSKTIWKAILRPTEVQEIEVPIGAELLCVGAQFEEICVWYRCTPTAPKEHQKIAVVGTGHSAPEDGHYLGTVQLSGGRLVFHIFAQHA